LLLNPLTIHQDPLQGLQGFTFPKYILSRYKTSSIHYLELYKAIPNILRRFFMYKRFYGILLIVATLFITQSFISEAQIVRDGIKIRVFSKTDKGKSFEKQESDLLSESGMMCCFGVSQFDRIELAGSATVTVMVRDGSASENGDIVYLNKGYSLEKKATFKPFEGRDEFDGGHRWTVYIMKDDKVILQFEYEYLSCT
jgi:hypothetical protein